MAGDLHIKEGLLNPGRVPTGSVSHHYGSSLVVGELGPGAESPVEREAAGAAVSAPQSEAGLAAFRLRSSEVFRKAKANRPYERASWNGEEGADLLPPHPPEKLMSMLVERAPGVAEAAGAAAATSQRLSGKVAVGVVVVSGPGALAFSAAETTKVHAEVQNGLSWLGSHTGTTQPVQFFYDLQNVTLTLPDDPNGTDKEGYWRNPTMQQLGFADPAAYVQHLISSLSTDWGYCAFFVKYSQSWFAYAYLGGPYLCMQYSNDGWGPDNIDRVFAHETGHIFNAPDEYSASGCNCTSTFGIYSVVNGNCETCAAGGAVDCIMRGNTWAMCRYTLWHLGCPSLSSAIASTAFPNVYLRMDGTGVTQPTGPGGGTVNCQYTAMSWEKFELVLQKDPNGRNDGTFSIKSTVFPNVFLRMDGNGVTQPTGPGGGTVNCQYTAMAWECYRLQPWQ